MAETFGKKPPDNDKRPAPTIEGTATEVSVESPDDTKAAGDQHDEAVRGETTDESSPPPPRPSQARTFGTHLGAGLLGGVAGVIAGLLAWNGLDLGGENSVAPKLSVVEERLAKLEAATKELETRAPETPSEISALQERVTQTEAALETFTETEQRLSDRLDAAFAKADDANASTVQALQDQIADLRTRLGALSQSEQTFETEEVKPELDALAARVAKLEAAIPNVAEIVGKETEEAKTAALAIAFSNLRAALGDGRPYAAELDTLKALSPDTDLGALAAHATTGIATLPALAKSFATSKSAALTKAPPASDGSLLGDLQARAQSLVTIRRLDAPATGDDEAATLARAEADLNQGKLADSVKQVETLSGPPREAFAAWLDQARSRLDAEDELKRLEGSLLVSVGGGSRQTGQD